MRPAFAPSTSCSPGSAINGARSPPKICLAVVELLGFGEMRHVAGMDDELRLPRERVDRGDRAFERPETSGLAA